MNPRVIIASLLAPIALASVLAAAVTVTEEHQVIGYYKYPGYDTARVNGEGAQGMCIYKDTAFLFNNTGYCRLFDLKKSKVVAEFPLDVSSKENHSNCANFGVEFPAGNKQFPAIYVSECYGKRRCFVESITEKGSKLIQTIRLAVGDKTAWPYDRVTDEDIKTDFARTFDWFIDKENKFLYTIAFTGDFATSSKMGGKDKGYVIVKLPLPKLADGDVTFTQKDILAQFTITFMELSQGGVIRDGKLYLPVGHAQPPKPKEGAKPKKDLKDRALIIVNLAAQKIEANHNFSGNKNGGGKTIREPEDADFHGDKLLMWCGQKGGLWLIEGL
ncbi:MAG: hypothetical protein LBM92_07905 [Opitutaceae bacterium]|jgi:hypothetical protein|nr:hypothetical protein [Opitutaceae bacterium]